MELYIIRHGKTIWNKDNRLQGTQNISLTEEGIEAAEKLQKELADVDFDIIYSSPLNRALETAKIIAGVKNVAIVKDSRIREIEFGALEGKTYEEMESSDLPYRYFFTAPEKFQPAQNGETLEALCARTKNFIQEVIEPQYGKSTRIMIVAHGALNKAIMCYLDNHGIKDFWKGGLQKNCDAAIFDYDGKNWKLIKN